MKTDNGIQYTLIEDQDHLERSMRELTSASWVAIDTEFIPEKRYRPQLCIIQIATTHENYIIDCKYVHDLHPFLSILHNADIVKITHAGKNDYEIFSNEYGILPKNVLDTQIAHSFIEGIPEPSLEFLVSNMLDIDISKEEQNSDWWGHPLTPEQIEYALGDVIHLHKLMEAILNRLHESHRAEWAIQECQRLEDSAYYSKDEVLCYQKYKWVRYLDAEKFALMRKIVEWREKKAQESNMPPEFVVKFGDLRELLECFFDRLEHQTNNGRTIPGNQRKHLAQFHQLFTTITNEDIDQAAKIQEQLPPNDQEDPTFHWKYSFAKLLIKYSCLQVGFRSEMACTSGELLHCLWNKTLDQSILNAGWRKDLLGESFIKLFGDTEDFQVTHNEQGILIVPRNND